MAFPSPRDDPVTRTTFASSATILSVDELFDVAGRNDRLALVDIKASALLAASAKKERMVEIFMMQRVLVVTSC